MRNPANPAHSFGAFLVAVLVCNLAAVLIVRMHAWVLGGWDLEPARAPVGLRGPAKQAARTPCRGWLSQAKNLSHNGAAAEARTHESNRRIVFLKT